jgi:hypothetical protein
LSDLYYLNLRGGGRERVEIRAAGVDEARNMAVRYLGQYLTEHPAFADEGHWRLSVEDVAGSVLTTVIVATVTPR